MSLSSKHNILLIGIGGIGMSGLAKYFIEKNKRTWNRELISSLLRAFRSEPNSSFRQIGH